MAGTILVSAYKTKVRRRLQDDDFDSDLLTDFADDVNSEIVNADEWSFMERTFNGTIAATDYTYDLAATIPTMQAVIAIQITDPDSNAEPLSYMPYEQFFYENPDPAAATAAHPHNFTLFGSDLIFPADPDQTYTLRLQYLANPATIDGDSDTLDIPDSCREIVVLGMYRRALMANDNFDQAQAILINEYEPLYQKMARRYQRRQFGQLLTMGNGRVNTGVDW